MFPLLSSAYLAPVQWYAKLFQSNGCWMEQHDHFIKQTYRNRCIIATANGPQALTIPIERPSGEQASRMAMKDIRISDHGNWRHIHWQAIVSAYNESPFFEYYADDFRPFFERRFAFLFDFNLELTHTICTLLDFTPNIILTPAFVPTQAQLASGA
ncbi:MAG: WbqC family protein, partial [Prevotella sp.]